MNNLDKRKVLATRKRDDQNGLDKLMNRTSSVNVLQTKSAIKVLHASYGHLIYTRLSHLSQKERELGLPNLEISKKICGQCLAGCQIRKRF